MLNLDLLHPSTIVLHPSLKKRHAYSNILLPFILNNVIFLVRRMTMHVSVHVDVSVLYSRSPQPEPYLQGHAPRRCPGACRHFSVAWGGAKGAGPRFSPAQAVSARGRAAESGPMCFTARRWLAETALEAVLLILKMCSDTYSPNLCHFLGFKVLWNEIKLQMIVCHPRPKSYPLPLMPSYYSSPFH